MKDIGLLFILILGTARTVPGQFPPEIRGQVLDAVGAAGVAGAEVALSDGAKAVTNADGSFVLRAFRPGMTELRVHAIGYAPLGRTIALANGRVEAVVLAMTPKGVTLAELATTSERRAAGATVLDRARIERSGATDLGEILQQEPGVVVTRRGGPASPATISIRGSSADQVLVLVNGVPLNDPLTGQADLSLVPLSAVEQITVLRGAQSARYGPRALGGVIAVDTRQPDGGEAQATLGAGRWGTHHASGRLALRGGGARQLAATLGAEWRDFGGRFPIAIPPERGGGTGIRDNADADALTLDGAVGIEGSRVGGRVHAEFFDVARGMPGTVVQPSLSARQTQRRASLGGEGRVRFGHGAATLGLTAQRQDGTFTDSTPPFGAPYDQRTRVTTLLGTATVTQRIAGGHFTTGVEGRRLDVTSNTLDDDARDAVRFGGFWATYRAPSFRRGRWEIGTSVGARADAATLTRGVVLSPQIGVDVRRGQWSGEVRWAQAYNPPSLADLFFQEGVQIKANPNLGAERVRDEWTVAVSVRDIQAGWLRAELSAAVYRADIGGMIVWSPDFRYVWSPANFDVQRRGVDFAARLTPRGEAFTLSGSAAYTDVRHTGPVLLGQVPYRPRWTATGSAESRPFGLETRLSYRYTGARPTAPGSDLNLLDPMHMIDLRLARDLTLGRTRLRVAGLVDNVLDSRAAMLIDYPFPGRLFRAELTFFHRLGDS